MTPVLPVTPISSAVPAMAAELDHIGVAVADLGQARAAWERLGLLVGGVETVAAAGVRVAMVSLGGSRLELLEGLGAESVVARFVARRGEGVHHLAVRVAAVDAEFARMQAAGVRLASAAVGVGAGGHRYFFVHPADAGGVLLEIVGD